jgi:hypothetical protein
MLKHLGAPIMIVYSHREALLSIVLPNDIGVKKRFDLGRGREVELAFSFRNIGFFVNDVCADLDALITDVDVWSSDELADFTLALRTKGAAQRRSVCCTSTTHLVT